MSKRTGVALATVIVLLAAIAVIEGTMASNNGSDNIVPIPRKNVRRGRAFFVINIQSALLI